MPDDKMLNASRTLRRAAKKWNGAFPVEMYGLDAAASDRERTVVRVRYYVSGDCDVMGERVIDPKGSAVDRFWVATTNRHDGPGTRHANDMIRAEAIVAALNHMVGAS